MTPRERIELLLRQMGHMHAALASLKAEVLPQSEAMYQLMAEGPLDELGRLQAELDALTGVSQLIEDRAPLWLHIEGRGVSWPEAPTSVLTALLDALRKGVQAVTEYIARGAQGTRPTSAIRSACDLRIIGLQPGSLRVGVSLPERDALETDSGPVFDKAVEALERYVRVAAWVGSDEPPQALEEAVPDRELRVLLLNQVKQLAPRPRGGVTRVGLEGRLVGTGRPISLTRDVHARIAEVIAEPSNEHERKTYRGDLREIDLDDLKFTLRNIEEDEDKVVTCHFDAALIDTAKEALDRRVEVDAVVQKESGPRARGRRVTVLGLVILDDESSDPIDG